MTSGLFFYYELLSSVIERYQDCSPKLKAELDDYIKQFRIFCQKRLCEVPIGAFSAKKVHPEDVRIKLDAVFTIPLKNIKAVIKKLSSILNTSLHLVDVVEGCVELTFVCTHEIDVIFPLRAKQKQELSQTKVLKVYNDEEVFYERVKFVAESRQTSVGELCTERKGHAYSGV